MRTGFPRLAGGALLCAAAATLVVPAAASPSVDLGVDPDWYGSTNSSPVLVGTVRSEDSPVDPASFRLYLDGDLLYSGEVLSWFRYPGASFHHKIVDDAGLTVTWEYHHGCLHPEAFPGGRHTVRFTYRDAAGNRYGEDVDFSFTVDQEPPSARFQGLELRVQDRDSGPFLDPRLEAGPLTICPRAPSDLVPSLLRQAPGWEAGADGPDEAGLKLDIWAPAGEGAPRAAGALLKTEWIGRTVLGRWAHGALVVDLAPLLPSDPPAVQAATDVVAYSRRLVLSGQGPPPPGLVATLADRGLRWRLDARRGDLMVYLEGPRDRAGNAAPPLFLAGRRGEDVEGTASGPRIPGGGVAAGREPIAPGGRAQAGPESAAQLDILGITGARVYPNPMNPAVENAVIAFDLSKPAEVEVTAYDWTGDYVDTIFEGAGVVGPNRVEWGGQTEDGRKLGNGVYLIRIVASTSARKESSVLKAVVWNED